jgi:hypothetical protein
MSGKMRKKKIYRGRVIFVNPSVTTYTNTVTKKIAPIKTFIENLLNRF